MVRVFVGITVPADIKRYVMGIQSGLVALPAKTKFVESENLHVSLSFLGEIDENHIESIKSKLVALANLHEKFKIAFGGLELIPNGQFIRVIALAVKSGYLEALRKEIVKTVGGESHSAHLTLARVSNVAEKKKFVDVIKEIKCEEKNMLVGDICLIQSTLQKHGPLYTVLHKSYLK